MKRLNIAMLGEQQVVTQSQAEPVQSELEVLGSQVEDDLLQAQQTQSQIDAMDGAVADAQQAQEDLEQEQQAAEQATQLPKEQQQAALESIQRNVKSILNTIGLCNAPGFGMESNAENITIALEMTTQDIKAFVKKIWDKIIEVWHRTVDMVKDFLNKIFSGAERLKKRAQQVKEAVKSISGKAAPVDKQFDAPASVKNYMRLNYKPIPAATVAIGLKGQNKLNTDIINSLTNKEAVRHYERTIEIYTENLLKEVVNGTKDAVEEIASAYNRVIEPVLNLFPQEKDNLFGTHAFISDRVITINKETAFIDIAEIDGFGDLKDDHDILDPSEISKVADVVIEQMENYRSVDKAFSDFKEFTNTLTKAQENLSKKLMVTSQEYSKIKDITFTSSEVSRLVGKIMQIIKTASTKIRMIDMDINKAAIDWCVASMRLYS
jgi:hypothetical protein